MKVKQRIILFVDGVCMVHETICFNKHPCGLPTDLHCTACRIEGMFCCQCKEQITKLSDGDVKE